MFATHCADRGGVFYHMAKALQLKEATVIDSQSWYGEMWMPQYPKPYPTDGHPDKTDLSEAFEYGKNVVDHRHRIAEGETDLIPQTFGRARERLHVANIPMRLNMEKCVFPKCRLCERKCPMGAIDFNPKPPLFRHPGRCVNCLLCEIICPHGAIEADYTEDAARARETVIPTVAGVVALLLEDEPTLTPDQVKYRLLQTGSLAFDASTYEIWGGLLNGAWLYMAQRDELLNAELLESLIKEYPIFMPIFELMEFFNKKSCV